jgi:ankyrin repeat protein
LEEVKRLIQQKKANVNELDDQRQTPLMAAAFNQNGLDILKFLMSKKANLDARDASDWTALHCAASCNNLKACEYLILKGSDVCAVNADGSSVLHYLVRSYTARAIEPGTDFVASSLLQLDTNFETQHQQFITVFRLLIEKGLDINVRNSHNETPLHAACMRGNEAAVRLLCIYKADIHVENTNQETCLHYATRGGNKLIVSILLELGSNPNAVGAHGTPLDIAKAGSMTELITLFQSATSNPSSGLDESSSESQGQVVKTGYLLQRTKIDKKYHWERRWVVAKEHNICTFFSRLDSKPVDVICRDNRASIKDSTSIEMEGKHGFEIEVGGTNYLFMTDSLDSKQEWVRLLRETRKGSANALRVHSKDILVRTESLPRPEELKALDSRSLTVDLSRRARTFKHDYAQLLLLILEELGVHPSKFWNMCACSSIYSKISGYMLSGTSDAMGVAAVLPTWFKDEMKLVAGNNLGIMQVILVLHCQMKHYLGKKLDGETVLENIFSLVEELEGNLHLVDRQVKSVMSWFFPQLLEYLTVCYVKQGDPQFDKFVSSLQACFTENCATTLYLLSGEYLMDKSLLATIKLGPQGKKSDTEDASKRLEKIKKTAETINQDLVQGLLPLSSERFLVKWEQSMSSSEPPIPTVEKGQALANVLIYYGELAPVLGCLIKSLPEVLCRDLLVLENGSLRQVSSKADTAGMPVSSMRQMSKLVERCYRVVNFLEWLRCVWPTKEGQLSVTGGEGRDRRFIIRQMFVLATLLRSLDEVELAFSLPEVWDVWSKFLVFADQVLKHLALCAYQILDQESVRESLCLFIVQTKWMIDQLVQLEDQQSTTVEL